MSKQSLRQALEKMQARLTENLVDFTSSKIKKVTEEIKEEIDTEYNYFFRFISDEVIGAITTPGLLGEFTQWKDLSEKWMKYKRTDEFYIGLSNSLTMGSALHRRGSVGLSRLRSNGTMPRGMFSVGSFKSYIDSLNKVGMTARFFGPVTIGYDFQTPGTNTITSTQENNSVLRARVHSKQRGVFVAFPKSLKMTATITAFGNLKGVSMDEWSIVDYIIKRIDPGNEKQWVKINSRYGFGRRQRPIRAVITPILKFYIGVRFPEIVKAAVQSRR